VKKLYFALCVLALSGPLAAAPWQPAAGHRQIPIWPGKPPNSLAVGAETVETSKNLIGGKTIVAVKNVSRPTMTVYSPKGKNTGVAVLVFPGGGYQILAMDLEGTEICDWLTSKGITAVLLKYRVPNSGPHWDDRLKRHVVPHTLTALQDAQRTMGLVRLHAAEWHIDPHKVGVLGFSAGGHLVAATSNSFKHRAYPVLDAADRQSCRPDFAVALYPGHLWTGDKMGFNPAIHVTKNTSPTFLLQAENDYVDNVNQALVYYIALKDARVPVEMHLYAEGGHAFGLRPSPHPITRWPRLVETWLHTIGMLR
jgi:acetyl esterase/lipase